MKNDFIERLYTESEYYNIVRNTIICKIRNVRIYISKHDLDDCIAEVYKVAVKKRKEIEKHPLIEGWLTETAKFVAKRYLTQKCLENRIFYISDKKIIETLDFSGEEQKLYNELLDLLKNNLRPSEYELFTMKFIEKRPTAKIAEVIRIKPHSVENRITALKRKIKNILKI